MKDIIVGIDRSETARRAAEAAAEMAATYDTNLHLVMCVDRSSAANVAVGQDRFHSDWVSQAEQFVEDMKRTLPHDRFTQTIGLGEPAKVLCEEAERLDARAIVVGNRRVQGMSRILGSVAGDVMRQAPCDILVANTRAD